MGNQEWILSHMHTKTKGNQCMIEMKCLAGTACTWMEIVNRVAISYVILPAGTMHTWVPMVENVVPAGHNIYHVASQYHAYMDQDGREYSTSRT
jgi:hypothetical protein